MANELYTEQANPLIQSPANKPFDELLLMTEKEFRSWAKSMRAEVARLWRERDIPPTLGFTVEEIASQFQAISGYDVSNFLVTNGLTGRADCILPTSALGSACRAFFSNMGKTKDITAKSGKGYSQWDYFTDPELFEKFLSRMRRHFKRDGYYAFSRPITINSFGLEIFYREPLIRVRRILRLWAPHTDGLVRPRKYRTLSPVGDQSRGVRLGFLVRRQV